MPPKNIKIVSDGNELEYQNSIKDYHVYKYTVSETKKGNLAGWTNDEITKLLKNKIIQAI